MTKTTTDPTKKICPAFLVTAPSSGQGKTTIVAALAHMWRKRGWRVQIFKCGADFIDASWHAFASGQPVHPLDLWMVGEADCRTMLHHARLHNDVVLVEGVMGLFDGQPSSADLAKKFNLSVVAVVDAGRMAGTLGAVAYGLQHYCSDIRWSGVLANCVASSGHAEMLQESVKAESNWLGAVYRNTSCTVESRHLGLFLAAEMQDATQRLDAAVEALKDTALAKADIEALNVLASMQHANPATIPIENTKPQPLLHGRTIAVARDAACCFIYAANIQILEKLGARVVFFSPLSDAVLPTCDAVWLTGGYSELHLQTLANNRSMQNSMRAHIEKEKPVWAEGGGMVLLAETITLADNTTQAVWGLIPANVQMHTRLQGLGAQALDVATINTQTLHAIASDLRGHTLHYSSLHTDAPEQTRTTCPNKNSRGKAGKVVYQFGTAGNVRASYFHAWFASSPAATAALFLP